MMSPISPIGKEIKRRLAQAGWTQRTLARIMGRPEQAISEIVHGKRRVTVRTASELESVLGASAMFWLKMDARYRIDTKGGR